MTTPIVFTPPPAPTSFGFILTKLAFKKRFPPSKWKAAKAAAEAGNADLADFFEDWNISTHIDLRRATNSVMFLTTVPVESGFKLTSQEAANVLAECTDPIELPGSVRLSYGLPEIPNL